MSQVSPSSAGPVADRVVAFAKDLDRFGTSPALVSGRTILTYADLSARVAEVRARLAGERRLVLLRGSNTVETVVGYLAALSAGHAVVIAPSDKPASWLRDAGYHPDVVVTGSDVEVLRTAPRYRLHPDLALLLSTSGSTGSGKLVRLSQRNLESNAESIATYLGITSADRAVTTLPMHYCYGLSVIHSYLARGASLLLTDGSVADPGFWDAAREAGVTSFAGVPHTFELLDRIGFDGIALPDLRYVTQAGGRMAPERVRQFAELGRRDGWDLFVMYGQTEATARMAYLPPELVLEHTGAVGVAVPGGSFRIDPIDDWPDDGTGAGELCYSGPNVMLGYAQSPADLALGREVDELRTGDVARIDDAGLVQIVGRRSRFLKLFGLRIDLQQTEDLLAQQGWTTVCTGDDDALQVAVVGHADPEAVRAVIIARLGLPGHVVQVIDVPDVPRLETGKVDYVGLRARFPARVPADDDRAATGDATDLRTLYATLLNRPDATDDDTFVSLGGDSLSYVEMTVRLEQAIGVIPANWHLTPIRELQAMARPQAGRRRRRGARLETSVALRALAIVVIVSNHNGFWERIEEHFDYRFEIDLWGGAYALLAIAGFNLARFALSPGDRRARLHSIAGSLTRLLAITVPVLAVVAAVVGSVTVRGLFDPHYVWHVEWLDETPLTHREPQFWFIVLLIVLDILVLAFLAIPWVHRLSTAYRFYFPLGLLALDVLAHYAIDTSPDALMPLDLFWLFALGWAIAEARRVWQRAILTAFVLVVMVLGLPVLDSQTPYGAAILTVLIWLPWLPSTRLLNRVLGWIAASTLAIYLTHFQVIQMMHGSPYEALWSRPLQIVVAVVFGVVYFKVAEWVIARVTRWWQTRSGRGATPPVAVAANEVTAVAVPATLP